MEIDKVEYNSNNIKRIVKELTEGHKRVTQLSLAAKMNLTVTQMFYPNPTARNIGIFSSVLKVEPNKFFDIKWKYDQEIIKRDVVTQPLKDYTLNNDMTREELFQLLYEQQLKITQLMEENERLKKLLNL